MAYDKVVDSADLDAGLTAVADAIREKTGKAESLVFPGGFVTAIAEIVTGGSSDSTMSGEVHDIPIGSDVNNGDQVLLNGNAFVAENYSKNGFMAILVNTDPPSASSGTMLSFIHGNVNFGSSNVAHYGCYANASGTMAVSVSKISTKISETTTANSLYADDTGAVGVRIGYANTLPAGSYKLILLCFNI